MQFPGPKEVQKENSEKLVENIGFKSAFEKISKELKRMPYNFQEIFNEEWFKKHLRQKSNGVFEIRCTIEKVPISGSGKTIETAARNFISAIVAIGKDKKPTGKTVYFNDFAEKWFEVVKRPTVKKTTYESLLNVYNVNIQPYFNGKAIKSLTAMQIQPLFTKLIRQDKTRTAQLVKFLLNQIFKSAVGEKLIDSNPMDGVQVLKFESVKGTALSIEEELALLSALKGSEYELSLILLLYGGMRRGELASVRIADGFLIVQNGKRRINQLVTERKIPITPMLERYLAKVSPRELKAATKQKTETLTKNFKRLCPSHHLHELRHTFITRCQECGVPREVVSVWAGHAADKTMTSNVYTHFSDEFMLAQGKKVDYLDRLYNR